MPADITAALPAGDTAALAARARLRCLDAGAEAESHASAISLLFPVFLLLAALVASLAAKRPAHPATETAVLASLADRFALEGRTGAQAADRDEAELLSALERLRARPERDAARGSETNPTLSDGDWRVTFPAERFFAEGANQPRHERGVLLYRLAQAAEALAPEGATIEVTAGPGPLAGSAPARLAEICRRLVDLGAPPEAIRLRSRREGADAVTLALTGASRGV